MALVYSTDKGRVCPKCGWPERDCKCSTRKGGQGAKGDTGPPLTRVVAKLRLEKKGRGGKTVSVVYDLPGNAAFLKELCQELKRSCGTGGAVSENTVELQGDHRERLRDLLQARGFIVKG